MNFFNDNILNEHFIDETHMDDLNKRTLVLKTQIAERALIIYVIESDLKDNHYPRQYKLALKDEMKNHKMAIKEYKKLLKRLI